MYGEEASKLARETKRTIDHFPPYNDSLVRSITREIRHLHETCQSLIREFEVQKQHEEQEAENRWRMLYGQPAAGEGDGGAGGRESGEVDPNHTTLAMLEPIPSASYSSISTVVHPHGSESGTRVISSSGSTVSGVTTGGATAVGTAPTSSLSSTSARSSTLPRPSQQSLQTAKEARLLHLKQLFWTKYLVHQTPLQRNKRILMAYHHQRVEKIKELAWSYSTTQLLPENLRRLLSPDEVTFFQEYEKSCRNMYTSMDEFVELDLGGVGMTAPPKEVFITVRVIKECGDIVTDSGAVLSLKKNSEHFVKRGDVERLITQGYLKHVA
ncbi:DNA replication complex GINS protein PSF1 [Mortierella sp. AD032]|nr:DNA replication complex GINS protein PSF1 [Mortierella sp. AD032]